MSYAFFFVHVGFSLGLSTFGSRIVCVGFSLIFLPKTCRILIKFKSFFPLLCQGWFAKGLIKVF